MGGRERSGGIERDVDAMERVRGEGKGEEEEGKRCNREEGNEFHDSMIKIKLESVRPTD